MSLDERVVAIIPAHNEEALIASTVQSVLSQSHRPDRVIVMLDNCTDDTKGVLVRSFGSRIEVYETVGNTARKAGALNQGLVMLDPEDAFVLQMDADTELHPQFVESALTEIRGGVDIGGVCARFTPQAPPKEFGRFARMLWLAQRHEFAREDSIRVQRRGTVSVLSGTATLFRSSALKLAGGWPEESIVEDYALSINLRTWGFSTISGTSTFCRTDVPFTLGGWWRQRSRWYRGTVDELRQRGYVDATSYDWRQQALNFAGMFLTLAACVAFVATIALGGNTQLTVLAIVIPLFAIYDRLSRLRHVDKMTAFDIFGVLFLSDAYHLMRQACVVQAWGRSFRNTKQAW